MERKLTVPVHLEDGEEPRGEPGLSTRTSRRSSEGHQGVVEPRRECVKPLRRARVMMGRNKRGMSAVTLDSSTYGLVVRSSELNQEIRLAKKDHSGDV